MKIRRRQIIKRQKMTRQPRQQSFISRLQRQQHGPLWYQTPEIGIEGLIAKIGSKKIKAVLKDKLMKEEKRPYIDIDNITGASNSL